jgi:CheY-like chemotaxis protein
VASRGKGQGAAFIVRLPIFNAPHVPDLDLAGPSAGVSARVRIAGVRILVVDDDSAAREIMRRLLSECAAVVETAESGHEALELVRQQPPDLLLCDIGMPGLDGLEFVRRLRAERVLVPAIAVTALARAEDRIRALQAGFNMHLSKPVEASELLAVVDTLLRTVAGERSVTV